MKPMTARQVFYQAPVHNVVDKTKAGYNKVQTDLVRMCRAGILPYDWLADNTRWQRKTRTLRSVERALLETARLYRKSLWEDANSYVEIWLEKDARSGVIMPVRSIAEAVDRHLRARQSGILKEAEASEREMLRAFVRDGL